MARRPAKAKRTPKPKMGKYIVAFGTPNHQETQLHDTPATAKNALLKALRELQTWGESYSHATRDQVQSIIEAVSALNLPDAKVGKEWEWRAGDEVSQMTFVYRIKRNL